MTTTFAEFGRVKKSGDTMRGDLDFPSGTRVTFGRPQERIQGFVNGLSLFAGDQGWSFGISSFGPGLAHQLSWPTSTTRPAEVGYENDANGPSFSRFTRDAHGGGERAYQWSIQDGVGGFFLLAELEDNLLSLSGSGDFIIKFPSTTSGQAQVSFNRSTDFFDLETPDGAGGANKIVRIGRQDFGGGIIVDEIEMDSGSNAAGQITFFRDSGTGTKGQLTYNELGSLYGRPNRSFDWFIPEKGDPTLTLLDNLLDM